MGFELGVIYTYGVLCYDTHVFMFMRYTLIYYVLSTRYILNTITIKEGRGKRIE